jgi:hypothetical protein
MSQILLAFHIYKKKFVLYIIFHIRSLKFFILYLVNINLK